MEWTQFVIFSVSVFGLFLWNRSESRTDMRQTQALIDAIRQDIKDFHGRLCTLEEKVKKRKENGLKN